MTANQVDLIKQKFLERFAETGNVRLSALEAGCGRSTVYAWKDADPEFALAFERAELEAVDSIDSELYRRGVAGWDEPVFRDGGQIGTVRKYSDTCLIFLAKSRSPKFRQDTVQLRHADADGRKLPFDAVSDFVASQLAGRDQA